MENKTNSKTDLVVGRDYRELVGLPATCKMVYQGNDTWACTKPDGTTATMTNAAQTAKVRACVCQPSVLVGRPR